MSTEFRSSAASVLCSRSAWATQLLDACDQKQIQFSELPPTCATTLCNFPDDTIRQRAQQLRGESVPADRQLAFRDYREVLEQSGDATKGKGVFVQHCSDCHQVEGRGYAIGPNLTSMVSRGNEGLLYNILVPNAEIDPRFASSTIVTNNGRVVSGVIAAESVSSVTLKGPKGEITTVLRVDIDEMFNSNISLMPDGLEKSIDKAGMADLLAYLRQSASKRKDANP
jgi:putative heme-binding domain-containing protein